MKKRINSVVYILLCAILLPAVAGAAEGTQVTMLLVADGHSPGHYNGAVLGQTEGNIQGQFLGINYELQHVTHDEALSATDTISAVIVAAPMTDLLSLAEAFTSRQVPVINIALADNELRATCQVENLYHTVPSDRMLEDAVAQWQQANPGAEVEARAWHPDFVKFAARDLNKRYTEQFDVPMNSAAWAGWAATRIMAEAVVRTGSNDPVALSAYLKNELVFDGQKGATHNFRPNGQLRQPLLLVDSEGSLLGEAPVRGVADSNDLDSLGLTNCD